MQKLIIVFLILFTTLIVNAQDSLVKQKDIVEVVFGKKMKLIPLTSDSLVTKKLYPSFLPIIGYNPAMGGVVGAGVSLAKLMGPRATTRVSSALANISFTTKKQINVNFKSNIYLPNDNWILQGDFRLLIFSQPTYGLGINFINGKDGSEGAQPMKFNYLRLYENVYKRISGSFYAGLGINYDGHSKINDESLDTTLPGINATSHYKYSITYGLPLTSYRAFGIAFNILHDSRNNAINPSSGSFAQLSFRANPAFMNNVGSSSLYYEYRTYFDFSKANRLKHVLAFWTWGQFQTNGRLPYLELPSITWDMYNRSGRGYIQGRIRGDNLVYGEAEYRFPITANGLLGGTAFFNAATASSDINNQKLGADYAPGYGVGLRIKMDKKTNTNITIDYGWGRNGSSALYFNLQEAF